MTFSRDARAAWTSAGTSYAWRPVESQGKCGASHRASHRVRSRKETSATIRTD
jgi:hypothetical protein